MLREIEVFQIGCPVTIGEKVKATVTGVCIREKLHVTYECTWWDGNTHHCKWMEQIEVKRHEGSASVRIGFSAVDA